MRKRILGTLATWAAMAVALALVLVMGSGTVHATSFNPAITTNLADPTAGAASDIIGTFEMPQGDSYFDVMVSYTPPGWTVAADADVPNGAIVAQLVSQVRVGLFGNTCSTGLTVGFNMMDASTNISDTVSPLTDPPAGVSRLKPLIDDVNPANGLPDGIDKYPSFLNIVLDPDDGGPLGPVQPRARLFGVSEVPTTDIAVILNFVVFEPGALAVFPDVEGGYASGGYPSVTVLNDPEAPLSPNDANTVTDFCSPLAVETTTFGISKDNICTPTPGPECFTLQGDHLTGVPGGTDSGEGGFDFRRNPTTSGVYTFSTYAVSLWDGDNDGIENPLDPCPLTPDPNWNPRGFYSVQPGGDSDGDGLPDSCDPEPLVTSPVRPGTAGYNEDQDLYINAADNCPLVKNGPEEASDQEDEDWDGIGDVCDPFPDDETNNGSSHRHEVCVTAQATVGAGGAQAPVSPCGEVPDSDGDGVPDPDDNCPLVANTDQTDTDGDDVGDACDPTMRHDLAVTSMALFGPAPFSIADTTQGTYLWVVARVANLATAAEHSTDTSHTVGAPDIGTLSLSVTSTVPDVFGSGDCTKSGDDKPFLPAVNQVYLSPETYQTVVYRVRIDCTASANTMPVLTATFGIDHDVGPSGGDDTTPANDSDTGLKQLYIVP